MDTLIPESYRWDTLQSFQGYIHSCEGTIIMTVPRKYSKKNTIIVQLSVQLIRQFTFFSHESCWANSSCSV